MEMEAHDFPDPASRTRGGAPPDVLRPDRGRLEADVRALAVVRHPVAAPDALKEAEDHVALELGAAGLRVERQLFEWRGAEFHNVLATRDGADPARPWVVVGGHFDSRSRTPGADDNATGVAAMLETARLLRGAPLEATVQFAGWNLEELQALPLHYALGSLAHARMLRAAGRAVAGTLNLEMLGYTSERQKLPVGVPLVKRMPKGGYFLAAVGDWGSRDLLEVFERTAQAYLPVVPLAVPLRGWLMPDVRRSDNARFWDEGFASLLITDTANLRNPHYHRASDTPETLDYDFLVRSTAAVAATVRALAS
ncbi:MAG TPA: M28 family peptidase [Gemmatimonadales bacterium]|nr:M28 family peptidase [Gemmatimonadales bacterium]